MSDPQVSSVTLHMAPLAGGAAESVALARRARGVWTGTLGSDTPIRYWIEARDDSGGHAVSPPQAPEVSYGAIRA